jgi:hypothetical protein
MIACYDDEWGPSMRLVFMHEAYLRGPNPDASSLGHRPLPICNLCIRCNPPLTQRYHHTRPEYPP